MRYVGQRFGHLEVRRELGEVLLPRSDRPSRARRVLLECVCLNERGGRACGRKRRIDSASVYKYRTCARCAEERYREGVRKGGRSRADKFRTEAKGEDTLSSLLECFTPEMFAKYREYVGNRTDLSDKVEAAEMVLAESRCRGCRECRAAA